MPKRSTEQTPTRPDKIGAELTMLPASTDVLIVGTGPTGLTLAAELRQCGVDPLIIDRSRPARTHRAPLSIAIAMINAWNRLVIGARSVHPADRAKIA